MAKRKSTKHSRSPPARPPLPERETEADGLEGLYEEAIWVELRQGARNVAGVRYQLAVTAFVLVESRAGALPFTRVVPEGLEDIDCIDGDRARWFIQVKEFGAGAGTFTASKVAGAIHHMAKAAPAASKLVALTDGQLDSRLVFTGWNQTIAQAAGASAEVLISALTGLGHERSEAETLVGRTHLLQLPWNLTPHTARTIAATYGTVPAIGMLVASRLLERLTDLAADQRQAPATSPGQVSPADVDALVADTLCVVDIESLDRAVRNGVCEVADYGGQPSVSRQGYLRGVDATPAHIGASFDVLRPRSSREVQVALQEARYALIAGPSGAGKSTQMWRSARDASPGARIIRVRRIESRSDLDDLVRYVRLLEPSSVSVVVVCCDDIGRPWTALWSTAVRRLLETSGLLLLGAVRYEDLTPTMLGHGGVLIDLRIDTDSALGIAAQLEASGMSLAMQPEEAISLADGRLMELIAILTTGQRMEAVLAGQAESLLNADDDTAVRVARLVCTAHSLGVAIDANELPRVIAVAAPVLTRALQRLQDEHIVALDPGTDWRGLHQRRSDALTTILHRTPPPTKATTLLDVLRTLQPGALAWSLRRCAELFGGVAWHLAAAADEGAKRCRHARDLAFLLEGLERADHSLTATIYIPIIDQHRPKGLSLAQLALLVCADKVGGISLPRESDNALGALFERIHVIASKLPDRTTLFTDAATAAVDTDAVTVLAVNAELEHAVRLLEVAQTPLDAAALSRLAARFPWPTGILSARERNLHARLRCAAYGLSNSKDHFVAAFGTLPMRLTQCAGADPNTVSATLDLAAEAIASLRLLVAPHERPAAERYDWDFDQVRGASKDVINEAAVSLATYVGECCPELDVVEVRTVLADESPLVFQGHEPGYKRLGRNARVPRRLVRLNVGLRGAVARLSASESWTRLVRARASAVTALGGLAEESARRLRDDDHVRRRDEWQKGLVSVEETLADAPTRPGASQFEHQVAAVAWDDESGEDRITKALAHIVHALQGLRPGMSQRLLKS